jgi:hypothetical protein
MEKLSRFLRVACCALSTTIVISCAAVTQQSAMRTKTKFDDVWRACLAAVVDIGYVVTSTDSTAGLIVAEQAVVGGGGKVSRLLTHPLRFSKDTHGRASARHDRGATGRRAA